MSDPPACSSWTLILACGTCSGRYFPGQGFHVSIAADGVEVRSIVARKPVDAVLLDPGVPGEGGFPLTRHLRGEWSGALIIITGRGEPADRVVVPERHAARPACAQPQFIQPEARRVWRSLAASDRARPSGGNGRAPRATSTTPAVGRNEIEAAEPRPTRYTARVTCAQVAARPASLMAQPAPARRGFVARGRWSTGSGVPRCTDRRCRPRAKASSRTDKRRYSRCQCC